MRVINSYLLILLFTGQVFAFPGVPEEFAEPKELSDLPGMSVEGPKYMLGVEEVIGVRGVAYLNDLKQAMAKYGLKNTHHLMIEFYKSQSGGLIEIGKVAVKINSPDGEISQAIELLPMTGGFGADVALMEKGVYHFTVGTKLSDGEKRTFVFSFEN